MASNIVCDKKDKLLVAAIDFGTTYSGYAFSMKHEYKDDPAKINVNQNWKAGSMALISLKTPTIVLFDENENFHSFGYEAEDAYSELALNEEHEKWFYFRRFKMRLHNKKIHRELVMDDDQGRTLSALRVFSAAIKYLKNHLLTSLKTQGTLVKNEDIHWIITVPAIWVDSAKQFMREAAYKADIDGASLSVALEPEAASLFCQHIPTNKTHSSDGAKFTVSQPGSKYMIVDLGGGTADITVHERQADGGIRELHKATGGAWGGTKVDDEFIQLLIKIVGGPVLQKFKADCMFDYIDFQRELEMKKRTVTPATKGKITIKVPSSLGAKYEAETGETVADAINGSSFKGKLEWLPDKIRIDAKVFKDLFKHCIEKIVEHVKELLALPNVAGTDTLLMVGGFSDCEMIQDAMIKAFPNCSVIIPQDAGLCVLKGAVIFGHRPVAITSRKSRYTYGINVSPLFNDKVHPAWRKTTIAGTNRCRDVFKKYITEGDEIKVGQIHSNSHTTVDIHQTSMMLRFFASTKKNPEYVDDDDSQYLGQMTVKLPDRPQLICVTVKMMFGETELAVEAEENATNTKYTCYFDFL